MKGFDVGINKGFTHIRVGSGTDDETVIYAGSHRDTVPEELSDTILEKHSEKENENSSVQDPIGVALCSDVPGINPAVAQNINAVQGGSSEDALSETTSDDFENPPMSTMQKCIIILAILFIVVFGLYYAFVR